MQQVSVAAPTPGTGLWFRPRLASDLELDSRPAVRNDGLAPMFTARSFRCLTPLYLPDEATRATPLAADLRVIP